MDEKIVQEILHELFSSFEALDKQSTAVLHFLKDKGIADDKELAPYLEEAGNASSVRWLAVRVRIDHLLSSVSKPSEKDTSKELQKAPEGRKQPDIKSQDGDKGERKDATTSQPTQNGERTDSQESTPKAEKKEESPEGATSDSADNRDAEKAA